MLNGIYTATSGLLVQQRRMDVISNNLANANTKGYKTDTATFSQYLANAGKHPDDVIRNSLYNKTINATARLDGIQTDFSMGSMQETGRSMDFALTNPKSYFAVDTPFGIRFTRNGDFTVDMDGELTTQEGYKVLSNLTVPQNVQVPQGGVPFVVSETGDILVNGVAAGRLATAEFDDMTKLEKVGSNLFAAVDMLPAESENPGIEQGFLEGSNVNPVSEMVRMIEANRSFETYQKVVQTIDELNSKAANSVGSMS
ncbi:flagellar basal-body rod protein FlgF [Seleniivibrio woodruffii]|uniref:Flagellar basal-body rod protein FlgG n=1 Tax=Seleniivibrio woodruffii TaxID=1078050 RepID=A0A4R1KC66_9BACT|nr:flagellar basal-body rod protein FlgF [Seleniivibrio woodruffii]TCK62115.1 flagellar basal-body rod protein FlgG [Seleniivibrio woodruffii]TVZ34768.1 flagellar basal-body rod protein FlgG [Seleniivibrio woodruffii]